MSETFAKSMRPHYLGEPETWREQDVAPTLNGYDMRQGEAAAPPLLVLISSTADSPARTSAWLATGPVYPASAAVCGLSSTVCCANCGHDGSSLKMFPDSLAATGVPTSVSYSGGWSTSGMASPGALWTRDGSECPSVVVACSLSAALETRPVPPKYWLSAKAAAGILRRAEERGKHLPPRLRTALERLAH